MKNRTPWKPTKPKKARRCLGTGQRTVFTGIFGGATADVHAAYCKMDTGYAPPKTYAQGAGLVHCFPGHSILSFWDNSVDSRPGSHSTFLLPESPLTFDEAVQKARQLFPEVFARFKFTPFEFKPLASQGVAANPILS